MQRSKTVGRGTPASTIKRSAIILGQLLVTGAGIFYVFHSAETRGQIATALRHASWQWLVLGWFAYGSVEALATTRWRMLLRIQNIRLGWWRAGAIVIVGLFFNMFLPGLIGGDVMRLYLLFKEAPRQRGRGTLAVTMDRLLGLLSITFLALTVVVFRFRWLNSSPATARITYLALVILGAAFTFVTLLFAAAAFGFAEKLPKRLPLRHIIVESADALDLYRARIGTTTLAFFLTVASHLAYYFSFYCAGRSLRDANTPTASVSEMLSIMPLVNAITGVPISFGGVGVRETLFQHFLGNLAHVPAAIAALSASLGFAVQASWGVLGGVAFLILRSMRR